MAVMKFTRQLRSDPSGAFMDKIVQQGTKVEILEVKEAQLYSKIRYGNAGSAIEGWVSSDAIDKAIDVLGSLDKSVFALNCCLRAMDFGVSPHYVMAIAQMRTDIKDGAAADGIGWGPFSLSMKEWNKFRDQPSLGLDYSEPDGENWRAQCMVFAAMTLIVQKKMAIFLAVQPKAVELALAHIIGHAAAVRLILAPNRPIDDILDGVSADEFAEDGVDRTNLFTRYSFLKGKSGTEILQGLGASLDTALDETRPFILQASADLLENAEQTVSGSAPNPSIDFRSSAIPGAPPDRRENAKLIATMFADAGYGTLQQIAAIANAIAESGLDAEIKAGGSEQSYGLFQLNRVGGVGQGHSVANLKKADYNIKTMLKYIKTKGTDEAKFRNTNSLQEAVAIFCIEFEKPANAQAKAATRFEIAKKLKA
jgi:Phage tail lysozyme